MIIITYLSILLYMDGRWGSVVSDAFICDCCDELYYTSNTYGYCYRTNGKCSRTMCNYCMDFINSSACDHCRDTKEHYARLTEIAEKERIEEEEYLANFPPLIPRGKSITAYKNE